MKLIYISPLRYPSEKAGSQFSMKSCEAFADQGIAVELWAPYRWNQFGGEDPFLFHHVKKNFRIITLPALDLSPLLPFFFFLLSFSFAIAAFFYALFRKEKNILYYSHEPFALFLLTFITPLSRLQYGLAVGMKKIFKFISKGSIPYEKVGGFVQDRTVYEIHDFPGRSVLFWWLFRRLDAVVTTNQWKKKEITKRFSFDAGRILAVFNAVDVQMFAIDVLRSEARRKLNLPHEKRIILYTGHLFGWKGVDTLLAAHRFLDPDEVIYFVGGTNEDIEKFKSKAQIITFESRSSGRGKSKIQSVVIVGRRPHEEIPLWLRAADVLVLPNTALEDISKYYTSPVKLFEYMASGTSIVASDLPSVREIVSEEDVCFVKPDDPEALYEGIKRVLSDHNFAGEISRNAVLKSKSYTWPRRTSRILSWLANRPSPNYDGNRL
ncbi:MAG: hypothetical protein A3C07_02855 [Candidatus Sungbacteria bacterium RIFCSPHIGHO2_02_FULL_47_11]|uniref:Glycosyl transferase family 1 domain-containing protein n=1 Tax=Candidatus Sungbacteria bacterium RIFCSPHIGHO2_02_FULL_47_11 TaxID=1802270 RepID=A0A1G2KKM3_9BACT|nr:MAG: hypothetical protein A3C07_02855 [Candidatus Sungbacteria bacterium RIFCSPHIGHO2_02_FULL_47_11]